MRLSTFRLWITAGFGVLVTELALLVYLFVRFTGEITSLQKTVRELKVENEQQSKEIRTLNREMGRSSKVLSEDRAMETVRRGGANSVVGPADYLFRFREAILRYDSEAQRSAEAGLRGLGSRGVQTIVGAYGSESSSEVRRALIVLLGSIPDLEALHFLEAKLPDSHEKPLRIAVLQAILQQTDAPSLSPLNNELTAERDPDVLRVLVDVIRKVNTDEAGAELIRKYDGLSESERVSFLPLLVGFKRPMLRPFYERVATASTDATIRTQCIQGIGECGDATAIPFLEKLKESDASEAVKREAERVITKLKG